ncbi:MAG TPA: class II fructose-bisphosphate aldolase [Roseiflexaceae bacterium]|nr:class II fructose-bisphosphate aldolase [Roseiflexaceae bacterium]
MPTGERPHNVITLREALPIAERGGYALGSFSPRCTAMIRPVLLAAEQARSPLIVQISSNEFRRYGVTPDAFATEFYQQLTAESISVPVVLHLDHTKDMATIAAAINAGFTSVMIDASELPLEENIARSREAADYAHEHGVSVEAELGRIGTTDFVETDDDTELYTDPDEAALFVAQTGVDALAVSVGTAHGVYEVRQPRVDYARLQAIRARTAVHLVLHGGSGVPAEMVGNAIRLPGGGVSKVNIATDLEVAALQALGRSERLTNDEMNALPDDQRAKAQAAVFSTVLEKMNHFLGSAGKADEPAWAQVTA